MEYTIDLPVCYENFDVFKQKASLILKSLFEFGRINDFMRFHKYGLITPLNYKRNTIKVEESEKFVRGKTNCMIYNLTVNKYNPGLYDKLIIYYNDMSNDSVWYGYIFYNSNTNELLHKYYINYADDKLYHELWHSFMLMGYKNLYEYYSDKFNSIKNNDLKNVKTIHDYKKMKQEIEEFKHKEFYIKI